MFTPIIICDLFRKRYSKIPEKCLTSTSKFACKRNLSSHRAYDHIPVVLEDFMILVNCCNQLDIRWKPCRISVDLGGVSILVKP